MRLKSPHYWTAGICALVMHQTAVAAGRDGSGPPVREFRSTKLGVAIDLGANWSTSTATNWLCEGSIAARDEMLQARILVIAFLNEQTVAYADLAVRQKFGGSLDDLVAERSMRFPFNDPHGSIVDYESKFTIATGETGRKIVHRSLSQSVANEKLVQDDTYISYLFVADGRSFEFDCQCETMEFANAEPSLDTLVESMRVLLQPMSPENSAKLMDYVGSGFRLTLPGDWEALTYSDDAFNAQMYARRRVDFHRLWQPDGRLRSYTAHIGVSSFHAKNESEFITVAEAERRLFESLAYVPNSQMSASSYRNSAGQQGRQVDTYSYFNGRHISTRRTLLLPTSDGRVQTLSCSLRLSEEKELAPVIELIRDSFIATDQ